MDEAQVDAGIELTHDILPLSRHRAVVLLPVDDVRFPSLLPVGDDRLPVQLPADKTDLALPDWVSERVEGAGIRLVS